MSLVFSGLFTIKVKRRIMILFQFVRQFYQTHRICLPKPTEGCSFNGQNFFYLITMFSMFISSATCFLYQAVTIIEYVLTFDESFTLLICICHFVTNLYKIPIAMDLIEMTQEIFNESKFREFVLLSNDMWLKSVKNEWNAALKLLNFALKDCWIIWI